MTFPFHFSRAIRLISVIIGCAIVEGVLLIVLIAPSVTDIQALSADVDARRRDLETRFERGAQVNIIRAEYQKLEPSINDWKRVFLPQQGELALITDLETLAGRHGVTQMISFQKSGEILPAPSQTRAFPLRVSVAGPFPSLLSYLRALERTPLIFTVQSWEVIKNLPSSELLSPAAPGSVFMQMEGTVWQTIDEHESKE